jgi:hypothetical protein
MPITIGDFHAAQSNTDGRLESTMGLFTSSMSGSSVNAPVDIDGSINRALDSFTARFVSGGLYPLIAATRGGSPNFGQTDATDDRKAMGLMDACHTQGLDSGGHMDPPEITGYLNRADVYSEIISNHPTGDIYIFAYHNMMESPDLTLADANEVARATYIGNQTGPNGSDWWLYDSNGVKKSFFTGQHGVNITDEAVPDAQGRRYPEYYASAEVQEKFIKPMIAAGLKTGVGGVNVMLDNYQLHPNKTNVDWNFNGQANDAQDFYDTDDNRHTAENISVTSLTRSGTTATCITAAPHGLTADTRVTIAGADQSEYNGTLQEANEGAYTIVSSTEFTYTVSGSPASPATGTITTTAADRYGQPVSSASAYYATWRKNYALGRKRIELNNPGIAILTNTNQWCDDRDPSIATQTWASTVATMPGVIKEYQLSGDSSKGDITGGFAEGNIDDDFPRSGVNQQGTNQNQGGSWQQFYNAMYLPVSAAKFPAIVLASGWIEGLNAPTTGAGGKNIYPNIPNNATTPWNLVRWFFGTTQLAGAHFAPSGVRPGSTAGRAASTPLYPYTGMVGGSVDYGFGTGNSKLFHKWMGVPESDPPTAAWDNTLWMRSWTNACIVVNPSLTTAKTVDVSALPGGATRWMFPIIDEDGGLNNGFNLVDVGDYSLPAIDASILVDRVWYEAL